MFVGALALWWRLSLCLPAGIAAGVANGIAGGGNLHHVSDPARIRRTGLQANLSTTVGVVPSYLGSLRVFRHHLARIVVSSLAHSVVRARCGARRDAAARRFGRRRFVSSCPGSMGAGTLLFAPRRSSRRRSSASIEHHASRRWRSRLACSSWPSYGGYFGAGLGILLLAVMAVALPLDINEIQGFATCSRS